MAVSHALGALLLVISGNLARFSSDFGTMFDLDVTSAQHFEGPDAHGALAHPRGRLAPFLCKRLT